MADFGGPVRDAPMSPGVAGAGAGSGFTTPDGGRGAARTFTPLGGSRAFADLLPVDGLDTPIKGPNTLKSQEMLMSDLQRENFNLKLRIYHMEEQMRQVIPGDAGQTVRRNIELTVQAEELQKELEDKTNLLLKAQRSIDAIAGSLEQKLEASRVELAAKSREMSGARTTISQLQGEVAAMQRQNVEADRQHNIARTRVQELEQGMRMTSTSDADAIASLEAERRTDKETILQLNEAVDAKTAEARESATDRDRTRLLETEVTEWRTKALAYEQKLQVHAADPEMVRAKDDTILELRRRLTAADERSQIQQQQMQQLGADAAAAAATAASHAAPAVAAAKDGRIFQLEQTQNRLHEEIAALKAAAATAQAEAAAAQAQLGAAHAAARDAGGGGASNRYSLGDAAAPLAVDPVVLAEKDRVIGELSARIVQLENTVQAVAAQAQGGGGGGGGGGGDGSGAGSALLMAKEQTIQNLRARIQTVEDLNSTLTAQSAEADGYAAADADAAAAGASEQIALLEGHLTQARRELSDARVAHRDGEARSANLQSQLDAASRQLRSGGGGGGGSANDDPQTVTSLQGLNRALKDQVAQYKTSQEESAGLLTAANALVSDLQHQVDAAKAGEGAGGGAPADGASARTVSEVAQSKDQMIDLLQSRIAELEMATHSTAAHRSGEASSQQHQVSEQARRISQLENEVAAVEADRRAMIADLSGKAAAADRLADAARVGAHASAETSVVLDQLKAKLALSGTALAEALAEASALKGACRSKDQVVTEMSARLTALQNRALSDIDATAGNAAANREQNDVIANLRAQLEVRVAEATSLRDKLRSGPTGEGSVAGELLRTRLVAAENRAAAAEQRLLQGVGGRHGSAAWDDSAAHEALDAADRMAAQLRDTREERDRMAFRLRTAETRVSDALKRVEESDLAIRTVQRSADEGAVATATLLGDMQAAKDDVQQQLDAANCTIAELQDAVNIQDSKEAETTAQLQDQDRYITTIGENNAKLTSEVSLLRTVEEDLARARDHSIRLSAELDGVKRDRAQAEKSLREQEDAIVQLRNRAVAFEGEARVARSVAKETEENDATMMRDLQTRLERASEELADREEDCRRLKDGFVDKESELRQTQRAADRSHALAQEQEQDIRHLVDQIRALEEDSCNLRRKVVELESVVQDQGVMQNTMDELARTVATKDDQLLALDADTRELSAKLLACEDELLGCRETIALERANVEQMEHLLQTRDATIQRLTEQVADLSECQVRERLRAEEVGRLTIMCDERDIKVQELINSLQSATMQLAEAQLKMTLTPEELAVLRADLDQTRAQAAHLSAELGARDRALAELEKLSADMAERGARDLELLAQREAEIGGLLDVRAAKEAVEAEAAKLATACEGLSMELEKVKDAFAASEQCKLELEVSLQRSRDESDVLLRERRSLDTELQHHVVARGDLVEKHTKMGRVLAETAAAQATAEEERNVYQHQTMTLADEVDSLTKHLAIADSDRHTLNDRVAALQLSLSERQAIDSAERERMGVLLRNTQLERDAFTEKLISSETDNERILAEAKVLSHEKERLELQVIASANEFKMASAAVAQKERNTNMLADELTDMSRLVEAANRERDMVADQKMAGDGRCEELELALRHLRDEAAALASRLDVASREKEALTIRVETTSKAMVDENRRLRESLAETTSLAERLREELVRSKRDTEQRDTQAQTELDEALAIIRATKDFADREERAARERTGMSRIGGGGVGVGGTRRW